MQFHSLHLLNFFCLISHDSQPLLRVFVCFPIIKFPDYIVLIFKTSPLSVRMRPQTLDEFVGQTHILSKGTLLYRAIQADRITSLIFYGPPGSGKTTLAHCISKKTNASQNKNAGTRAACRHQGPRPHAGCGRPLLHIGAGRSWRGCREDRGAGTRR